MSHGSALSPTRVRGATMLLRPGHGTWTVVPTGVREPQYLLNDVAAPSQTEAWAVGQTPDHPLIAHWDGLSWTGVAVGRSAGAVGAGLLGIDAAGPASAIAVGGAYDRLLGTDVPLILHWDGTDWAAPELGPGHVLTDVTMVSATEAWAVGHGRRDGDGPSEAVVLHWHVGGWTRTALPAVPRGRLLAVAAGSPRDVWAVGASDHEGLILRYDGRCWNRVPAPAGCRPLMDVVALSPDTAWAVDGGGVLSWDGSAWRRAGTPPLRSANTLSALAGSDIWVAGGAGELAHFDGRFWTRVGSPPPPGESAVWLGSASAAPGTVWMVGSASDAQPASRTDMTR